MQRIINLYREAFSGLPSTVWWLSLVIFINRMGGVVITFIALYLTQELGHPVTAAGVVLSAYGAGYLIGALVGGWATDRIGPLPVQVASLAVSGVALLLLEPLRSLWSIATVVLVVAIASEAFRPANYAALASYVPDELQARAVALNRLAVNLGWGVAPVLGGTLAAIDYHWLFRVDGLTCLAAAVAMGLLISTDRLPTAPTLATATLGDGGPDPDATLPWRDSAFLGFLVVTTLFAFVLFQGWGPYPIYLAEVYGINEATYGLLMAINAVMILLFEMVLTRWAERFPVLRMAGIGGFVLALGFALLPLGQGIAIAALSVAVWTFGEMLALPALGGWVAQRANAVHRGKYMGLYTMGWGLAFITGPTTGTFVYAELGPEALWYSVGGVGLVMWILAELIGKRLQTGDRTEPGEAERSSDSSALAEQAATG